MREPIFNELVADGLRRDLISAANVPAIVELFREERAARGDEASDWDVLSEVLIRALDLDLIDAGFPALLSTLRRRCKPRRDQGAEAQPIGGDAA